MTGGQVRVAVVGAGEIGRGWATLCVAHGWPVALYDHEGSGLQSARDEVMERARGLPSLIGADPESVERGVAGLQQGRSLLHACQDAEWVIEAIHEDLIAKQKLFEGLESAAPKARIVSSSTSTLLPQDLAARCRRPDRLLVTHPQHPVELIPLVEILSAPATDRVLVELAKGWLRALGRIPVTLKKPIRGNVAGRITAAVWREAIQLVLDGVIDVDDLDRAVSVGPGLGWAAAGPHLSYHLAGGRRGSAAFVQQTLQDFQGTWQELATWNQLEPGDQHRLVAAIERAYAGKVVEIRQARDRRLAAMLQALDASRQG
jgi:3-hydroxyacyl-CoA dehydrogenase